MIFEHTFMSSNAHKNGAEVLTLSAEKRERSEGVRRLRREGRIPAVLYGRSIESMPLSLSILEFSRVYRNAGENTLVSLETPDNAPVNVLIHEVQFEPVSGAFLHADFYQVRMDEKVETSVPLTFVGESPAVRELGGVLVKSMDEIEVSCLPANIPHAIEVPLSTLATFDDQIRVSDVAVPAGVEVLSELDTVIALVDRPRTEEEIASLNEKVDADVTKVEGVVKEAPASSESKEKK